LALVIQTKLMIGQPNDEFEQEADRVAEEVMRMPEPQVLQPAAISGSASPTRNPEVCRECAEELPGRPVAIQRVCPKCEGQLHRQQLEEEEEEKTVQAEEIAGRTPEVSPGVQAQINSLRGSGQPLAESVRSFFEPRFGRDFSAVRVHTGGEASSLARAVEAQAFTVGNDVVFGAARYAPDTAEGARLIAHELTHVVQQTDRIHRQHEDDDDAPEITTNPLVGLKRGDGLDFGTFEKKPRVKLLQQKLNEKIAAGLDTDGMFGRFTHEALNNFQLIIGSVPTDFVDQNTADRLMAEEPPEPGIPPDIPQPDLPKFPGDVFSCSALNLELEDIMNVILVKHNFFVPLYQNALERLEKDLADLETPGNIGKDVLEFTIKAAFDAILGGVLGGELKKLITEGLEKENTDEADRTFIVDSLVGPVLTAANDAAKTESAKAVGELLVNQPISLADFIDTQKAGVVDAASAAAEEFGIDGKAKLRKLQAGDEEACLLGEDPRVERARKLLRALNSQEAEAFRKQYEESLQGWALVQAQTKLGTTTGKTFGSEVSGTDLSKETEDVAGIIHVEFPVTEDPAHVTVSSAEISGLSAVVRSKLQKQGHTIGSLLFPVVARGVAAPFTIGSTGIEIAENEIGDVFNNTKSESGNRWLAARAMIAKGTSPPELINEFTPLVGARLILDEDIRPTKLSAIPDGLGEL
jgi:hypothetical protein